MAAGGRRAVHVHRDPVPNSHPEQVERQITRPVEEVLSTLSGIRKLHATSTPDGAEFELEFTWGQDIDLIRMKVSEKVDQVKPSLPADIGPILIYSFSTNDIPVIQGRISAEGVDLSANYELLEARVLNPIRRVPGVARVDLDGVAPREIFIDLVLDKVKEHGVDVGDLMERLAAPPPTSCSARSPSGASATPRARSAPSTRSRRSASW